MRFSLLGELEVDSGGRVIPIRGKRLRPLFACLLVNRNQTVSRDRLIDSVWGAQPPPTASHDLDALVSRLRNSLGAEVASRLETTPGGYRLHVAAEELDVDRFERLFAAGRRALDEGENDAATEHLRLALDEWHGEALGDLMYYPAFAEEAARLGELRLSAMEAMFEAMLHSCKHEDLVPQIEAFVTANPLRERARAQLMHALYGCGRQADALAVYQSGYRLLGEQGLEPGGELRNAQAAILQQDLLPRADQDRPDLPDTRYARNGDVAIAYQVSGEGPYDVLYAAPFVTNVELAWGVPRLAELLRHVGSFSRLIRFDKRGTGMSDAVKVGDLTTCVDDVRAVMDAALSTRAAIIGALEGGPLAILFAATHPERVWALVLWGATARVSWSEDYPFGVSKADLEHQATEDERIWTEPGYAEARARATGAADVQELASLWRQSATPGVIRALAKNYFAVDVRDALPLIRVPTLVLSREDDEGVTAGCRYLAEHIAGAQHVVIPGADRLMFAAGDLEPLVPVIRAFLDTAWKQHTADREHDSQSTPSGRLTSAAT